MRAPTLLIGYGNPSRGDDALGPAALDAIERLMPGLAQQDGPDRIELLTDFQLQIEFATDLADRRCIVFIDALGSGAAPFTFERLTARRDTSISTHAVSPAGLLAVYHDFMGVDAPPSFLLGIRGYGFELGEPLSAGAHANLDAAVAMLVQWLREERPDVVAEAA